MQILRQVAAGTVLLFTAASVLAQANLAIYTDRRVNGFEDWSWGLHHLSNTSPVHSGAMSISVSNAINEALSFYHPDFDTSPYASLSFWVHGGAGGGQVLRVQALLGGAAQPGTNLPALTSNTWLQFNIPLASLGAANKTNFNRFWLQRASGPATPFYVDDIQLIAKPAPAIVHLNVNSAQTVRSVDARWFGINAAVWDGNFDTVQTISLLNEMGTRVLRFPGGSMSDEYHWALNRNATNTFQWTTSFARFVRVATNVNAQCYITVSYGSSQGNSRGGQPKEAAAWVAYANASTNLYGTTNDIPLGLDEEGNDWRTAGYWARLRSMSAASNTNNQYDFLAIGRSAPLQIKYWEIGNENYGTWETDYNTNAPYRKNEGWTYAMRASNYFHFMKMVDPTIKIGVVVAPGETSYDNGYTAHSAYNPRTGQLKYGWTPVMLATLKTNGITPDFAVHHVYPQFTGQESDALLLQASSNWARDAADLRQQIADYFGPTGTNIELVCTENNSNAGQQGRQSTSLVNALYYADSLAQLMKTEFNAFVWWDLRNGTDFNGSFDPTIYGWRTYGDIGMINGVSNRYPHFYAAKMMQQFAQPGDTILNTTSDYLLLTSYAARKANGALSLLVLNKDTTTDFNAQIALTGFSPAYNAIVRSYDMRQDEATRTNAPYSAQDISVTNFAAAGPTFSYTFPRLSLNLLTLAPAAPSLSALSSGEPNQLVIRLEGQAGSRYVLQTAGTLSPPVTWTAVLTNLLATSTLTITNEISAGSPMQFWRTVWQP
jgi:alpha-L-arabinofuranosidase